MHWVTGNLLQQPIKYKLMFNFENINKKLSLVFFHPKISLNIPNLLKARQSKQCDLS